jgi:hypothetical protein
LSASKKEKKRFQTYIPNSSKNTTFINEKIAMDSKDEQIVSFTATGPVYPFFRPEKPTDLAKVLDVNRTTVSSIFKMKRIYYRCIDLPLPIIGETIAETIHLFFV